MLARRAIIISVSDKKGVFEFAQGVKRLGVEIFSTGGTFNKLKDVGVRNISDLTNFPECLDGRLKTLHPNVHGGLLAIRSDASHMKSLRDENIKLIDIVAVNLYPFKETMLKRGTNRAVVIENIDIGGPAMIRSAAKNHEYVTVIVDPDDYGIVLKELQEGGSTTLETRKWLAAKAFRHTAAYDAMVAGYLTEEAFPEKMTFTYDLQQILKYGENPHQKAAVYVDPLKKGGVINAKQLQGKQLSYNNIADADVAWSLVREYGKNTAAVAVKHQNPCGVAVGNTPAEAFTKAFNADPISIFGGIIAINAPVDKHTALLLEQVFLEVVIAPSFTLDALEVLSKKPNLRLLEAEYLPPVPYSKITTIEGGILLQDEDSFKDAKLICVTKRQPTQQEMMEMDFAWKAIKYVKSNGILLAQNGMTVGIGPGQTNRVGAAKIAIANAGERARGAVMASDAFFPMPDTVEVAVMAGVTAIIQPGGSIKDHESIEVCDKYGITMLFTKIRHFKH